jgi:transcriptional regulator with XRE-family HTH domain
MASPRGKNEASRAQTLGALVRQLRRERRYTLNQLAERIPMSASNLSRIELGAQGPPTEEVIDRLAQALEAPVADLRRAAGLHTPGETFEDAVLSRLEQISQEVREVRDEISAVTDRSS